MVSRSSRRPDLPAGRPPRAGEVKEGRRPARRRRALSLTGLSTVAPFLRSRRRKRLDAEHGIYQEDLLSLDDLRRRMSRSRQREQSLQGDLQSLRDRTADDPRVLRLTETLASFVERLRGTAETLDIDARPKIIRLLL